MNNYFTIIFISILLTGCNYPQGTYRSAYYRSIPTTNYYKKPTTAYNNPYKVNTPLPTSTRDLGKLSTNPYSRTTIGSQYNANSVNNKYGVYGSEYSNKSANNPYATNAPKLYDSQGNYRGRLSTNRYDPDSTSNPFGKYGNKFSPYSINNKFGAGNPFGPGLKIIGQ